MRMKRIISILILTFMFGGTIYSQTPNNQRQVYVDTLTTGGDTVSTYEPLEKYSYVYLTLQDSSSVFRDSIFVYQKVPVGTGSAPQTKYIQLGVKDVVPNNDWELIYSASGTDAKLWLVRLISPATLIAVRKNLRYVAGKRSILTWQGKNSAN